MKQPRLLTGTPEATVVLHHPPIRGGIPGMDADNLHDGDALARVLAPHGRRRPRITCSG